MTGLTVQSSILGVAGNGPTTAPIVAAGSLAMAVFRNDRNRNGANAHAPYRRRRQPASKNSPALETTERSGSSNSGIKIYRSWMRLPQLFRFCVAGNLGNLGFFYLEKVIFRMLSYLIVTTSVLSEVMLDGIEKYQDGMSFFSAYVIQIVTTHLLYAFLVYGMETVDTYEKYTKTLSGQFKVYGIGLFGATYLNSFLISNYGFSKTISFWTTTFTFAIFNYFLVSWVVKNAIESSSPKDPAGNNAGYQKKTSETARENKIML